MIAYEIALHVTKREGLSVEVLDGIANHLVLTSVAVSCSKNIKGPERSRAQSVWVFFSLFSRNNFTEELRISNGVESFSEQLRHVFQMLKSTENIFWGVSLPILGDENSKKKIWVIVMGIFYTDLLNIGGYQAITGEIEALIVRSNLKVELLSTILQIGSSKFTYQAKGINSTSSFFSKVIDLTKNLILGTCDLSNYGCVNYLQAFSGIYSLW